MLGMGTLFLPKPNFFFLLSKRDDLNLFSLPHPRLLLF